MRKYFISGVLFLFGSMGSAGNLSGVYQVLKSDCDSTGNFAVGQRILVQASHSRIRAGIIINLANRNGKIRTRQEFEAAFDFTVGIQKVGCMGDCYSLYEGKYSPDLQQFRDVELFAGTDASQPVYAGEVDFKLQGDNLEIDVTSAGQPRPVPLRICELHKLN